MAATGRAEIIAGRSAFAEPFALFGHEIGHGCEGRFAVTFFPGFVWALVHRYRKVAPGFHDWDGLGVTFADKWR